MLDIKLIRESPEIVKKDLKKIVKENMDSNHSLQTLSVLIGKVSLAYIGQCTF